MPSDRFERNEGFFGRVGQEKLRRCTITVLGVGGLGSHLVQQAAFLGIGCIRCIDPEELDLSNRNRYIGSFASDPIPGTLKIDIAKRLIASIDPDIRAEAYPYSLLDARSFEVIRTSDYVFGCVDKDGIRLVLTELCAAYTKALFDLASDIEADGDRLRYGGRLCVSRGDGCALCLGQIDATEAGLELGSQEVRKERENIYGVNRNALGQTGPSVVSINGLVASLALTEFMLEITGVRRANRLLTYRGDLGKVLVSTDPPSPDCFVCKGIWGQGAAAKLESKYLSE